MVVSVLFIFWGPVVQAAGTLTVDETLSTSNGTQVAVKGYIVGVPVGINNVQHSNFTSNYALALADNPNERQTEDMVFVKLEAEYRSEFGLQNNPSLKGTKVVVNGMRDDYFSHEGIEYVTSISQDSSEDGGGSPDTGDYYQEAEGLSGNGLKLALHDIIDDHTELSYSAVWDALRHTDEDPNNPNNVLLLYSGKSYDKYDHGGYVDDWNREHVWAKSHGDFGTARGPGTDLHHLRPTDVTVNSARGNLDFDDGGSALDEAPGTYYDGDSWEPRDSVKGDVARMIFYMSVRYEGDQGELDLEVANSVRTSGPYLGKLTTLKEWHEEDPVDDLERHRNEVIYTDYQSNRNPFIDHPEYVEQIW